MNRSTLIITSVSILAMIGFLVGAYLLTSTPQVTEFPELRELQQGDHTKWSKENKILFIDYSDFQCPACAAYTSMIDQFGDDADAKKIRQKVTFVYRHFPLDSIHPYARLAAQAAEAAGKQGKFFEMHDKLFASQSEWAGSDEPAKKFDEYAKELKLDVKKFQQDSKSKEASDRVQQDVLSGLEFDVSGTPTFFLNGKKINPPRTPEEFKKMILEEIDS